jgi:hypothetical protein
VFKFLPLQIASNQKGSLLSFDFYLATNYLCPRYLLFNVVERHSTRAKKITGGFLKHPSGINEMQRDRKDRTVQDLDSGK